MSNLNQHKPGYKHAAHFGWIPEEWHFNELGQKIDLLSGFAFESEKYSSGGTRLLRGANIKRGETDWSEENTTYWANVTPEIEKYLMQEGDLVIAMDGSLVGRSYAQISKNDLPCLLLQRVARIRSAEMDLTFLKSIIGSNYFIRYCDGVKTVTAIPHISSYDIKKFKVPVPCICEQRKIAAILSTWDEAITKTQQLIAQLRQRNKGLMQQLLTAKENWKEYRIGDLLKEVKRPVAWNDEELYHLISVRRRSGGAFFRESLYGKQILTKQLFTAEAGDFLISKMQIVHGASAVVPPAFAGMKISGSYIAVHAKDDDVMDINFFNWLSKTKWFYKLTYISSYGVHIEKMTFDFDDFKRRKIMLPPTVEEQNSIVNILQTASSEVKLHEQKLAALQQQKKGLMQKLLTGEVRMKIDNSQH